MKLSQKSLAATQRVVVYGDPKTGKTELVGKLAEVGWNLLFFDLENGFSTLKKLPTAAQERIELISIPDTKSYPIAIETMLKIILGNKVSICEKHGKVSCQLCTKDSSPFSTVELNTLPANYIVVVDSLSQLAASAMNHITKAKDDTYKPEWQDYANQGALMAKFLSHVQQAPYNVVCISHVIEAEMDNGAKKLAPVAGTTSFSRNAAKFFDHVVYCELKNKKHTFGSSTTYGNGIIAGSRTDVALETQQAPSLESIFGKAPV